MSQTTAASLGPVVLVIDDSATFRAAIGQALRGAGYTVHSAATGEEGLRMAAQLRPDAIVVDRFLPDADGTTVVRNLKLDVAMRRTPCLLVTADEDPAVEFAALETGADAYVQKDVDLEVLIARIATLLRGGSPVPGPVTAARRRVLVVGAGGNDVTPAATLPHEEYEVICLNRVPPAAATLESAEFDCVVIAGSDPAGLHAAMDALSPIARRRHVPVLVRGAGQDASLAVQVLGRGADDYVPSAADAALYVARLRALIRRKEFESEDRRVAEELLRGRTEADEARLRAQLAERESEFKSRFVAFMSHELRTPLSAILGYSQLLEEGVGGPLSPLQQKHVAAVRRSGQHLLALVNDVLDLSAIRAGKLTIRQAPVSVTEVLDDARLTVSALAQQRHIAIEWNAPAGLPALDADAVRVQQILFNLLSNAIKFTDEAGRISVDVTEDAGFIRIAVQDTGVGIRREDLPRLFKDFERIDTDQEHRPSGTGLGLSLTRHLVELHGGRVAVESEHGVGSIFTVWLPTVAAESTQA